MHRLQSKAAALAAWCARRTAWLNHPGAGRLACWLVPVLFGLLSLLLGQDDNWDLRNYHLYNPYALLNGRVGADMAQWQSYFNPALDLLYYGLLQALPAPLVGFVMGWLHGLNFVLVLAIARLLLAPGRARPRLLLALAGTLGAGFLSELGNSMGDNTVALLVLGALYLVLARWERLQRGGAGALGVALLAGLVLGAGAGLKLTNAVYAVALCLTLLLVGAGWRRRLGLACAHGAGVLAGLAATAGFWWWKMWLVYGNPLYPQFNAIFRSPLAQQGGVADTNYLPRGLGEALLWPFIFTRDVHRVSELTFRQILWPLVYLLFITYALVWLAARPRVRARAVPDQRASALLLFFALAYLLWLELFGIYRYLVPLELLAPLVVWLLLHRMLTAPRARLLATWSLSLAALWVFPFSTWGHSPWGGAAFSVSDPGIDHPGASVVYIAHGDPPMGWLTRFLPGELVFISVGAGFPETQAYVARAHALADSRPGPHYVLVFGHSDHEELTLRKKNAVVDALGLTSSARACAALDGMMRRVRFHVEVRALADTPDGARCRLTLAPAYQRDVAAQDRALVATVARTLARYDITVRPDTCRLHPAAIGAEPYPYQLCQVDEAAR